MNKELLLIFVACVGQTWGAGGDLNPLPEAITWCYGDSDCGPSNWADLAPEFCAGTKQSPIDLPDASKKASTGSISYNGYDTSSEVWMISNNGHSCSLYLEAPSEIPSIGGRRLGTEYEFLNMHFHWGADATEGSEHTEKGKAYAGEIHLVHWNTKYTDVAEALTKTDGLAVLGFFLEEVDNDNVDLTPITDQLSNLIEKDSQVTSIGGIDLEDIISVTEESPYYYYQGGLTTPACNEIVRWTVYSKAQVPISEAQLNKFRALKTGDSAPAPTLITNNFRPVQPLNGRKVSIRNLSPFDDLFDNLFENNPILTMVLAPFLAPLTLLPLIGPWFRILGN